jgi:hypothetical protein
VITIDLPMSAWTSIGPAGVEGFADFDLNKFLINSNIISPFSYL